MTESWHISIHDWFLSPADCCGWWSNHSQSKKRREKFFLLLTELQSIQFVSKDSGYKKKPQEASKGLIAIFSLHTERACDLSKNSSNKHQSIDSKRCQNWVKCVVVTVTAGVWEDKLVNHFLMSHLTSLCFGSRFIFLCCGPTMETDETGTRLPLVLPHQDVISSLKAYQAHSNDIEWLNCVFWWISLWVIWCQIVFQFSYCPDFRVCK